MSNSPPCLLLPLLQVRSRGISPAERIRIPPGQVCYQAWNPDRLQNALALLRAGETPPPIRVERVVGLPQPVYLVSEGNHRAAAAETLRLAVPAEVVGETTVQPEAFFFMPLGDACALWRDQGNGTAVLVNGDGFSPDQIAALCAWGVRKVRC